LYASLRCAHVVLGVGPAGAAAAGAAAGPAAAAGGVGLAAAEAAAVGQDTKITSAAVRKRVVMVVRR